MPSIYVHIPFCKSKCPYCDFVSFPGREGDFSRYFEAMKKETALRPWDETFHSVYFGGGTPSLPPPQSLADFLTFLRQTYEIGQDAQITCEANPGTLTERHFELWQAAGVNRLSLGAQAMQPHVLHRIGRAHAWKDVESAASFAKQAHMALSLDLMYGLPGQSVADFRDSLQAALALQPEHMSCYSLTIAENTPFGVRRPSLPSEDEEREMDALAAALLPAAGLPRYEVSNYARPENRCRYNWEVWHRGSYLGLGCAAASFRGNRRDVNLASLCGYMDAMERGALSFSETEILGEKEEDFEEFMLGLRLTEGFPPSFRALARYRERLEPFLRAGVLLENDDFLRLSPYGFDRMNSVLVALLD